MKTSPYIPSSFNESAREYCESTRINYPFTREHCEFTRTNCLFTREHCEFTRTNYPFTREHCESTRTNYPFTREYCEFTRVNPYHSLNIFKNKKYVEHQKHHEQAGRTIPGTSKHY